MPPGQEGSCCSGCGGGQRAKGSSSDCCGYSLFDARGPLYMRTLSPSFITRHRSHNKLSLSGGK